MIATRPIAFSHRITGLLTLLPWFRCLRTWSQKTKISPKWVLENMRCVVINFGNRSLRFVGFLSAFLCSFFLLLLIAALHRHHAGPDVSRSLRNRWGCKLPRGGILAISPRSHWQTTFKCPLVPAPQAQCKKNLKRFLQSLSGQNPSGCHLNRRSNYASFFWLSNGDTVIYGDFLPNFGFSI